MKIELTDKQANDWLARLEDPNTKRAEGRLRGSSDPEAMCCLGHLADILDSQAWTKGDMWWSWGDGNLGSGYGLPRVTYRGLPLDQTNMASVNDYQHRFPIEEIREWIEEARAQS